MPIDKAVDAELVRRQSRFWLICWLPRGLVDVPKLLDQYEQACKTLGMRELADAKKGRQIRDEALRDFVERTNSGPA